MLFNPKPQTKGKTMNTNKLDNYHIVAARDNAQSAWFIECGFNCFEDARAERSYAVDTYGARNVRIVTTANTKKSIECAVAALNN